jgi:LAO/AO transport system kinase
MTPLATWRQPDELAAQVRAGSRAALARAITLVESRAPAQRPAAHELLRLLLPHSGNSIRLGISGVPGAGKSTFIDAFGMHLLHGGRRVAVLAVDPSSGRSAGSILGDKTRMQRLSMDERAFVRPSPTSGTLGGVASRTREAMYLCEAAGFDTIIVETVGVGQSEITVAGMVDVYMLLLLGGAGDELQGIKKGVLEWADILAVNKADGAGERPARLAQRELTQALHYAGGDRGPWTPVVRTCSALHGSGIAELWDDVQAYRQTLGDAGVAERRAHQQRDWMWSLIREGLEDQFRNTPSVAAALSTIVDSVQRGEFGASEAADRLLAMFSET